MASQFLQHTAQYSTGQTHASPSFSQGHSAALKDPIVSEIQLDSNDPNDRHLTASASLRIPLEQHCNVWCAEDDPFAFVQENLPISDARPKERALGPGHEMPKWS